MNLSCALNFLEKKETIDGNYLFGFIDRKAASTACFRNILSTQQLPDSSTSSCLTRPKPEKSSGSSSLC